MSHPLPAGMEQYVHLVVLVSSLLVAIIMGAVAQKTHFCTMGAVSDWVNFGDTGRMRAWLLAIAVAAAGVSLLDFTGLAAIPDDTFPPYRMRSFAWLRYLLGGFMFGFGMTLASGCGSKTLLRIGGGNAKSLLVLVVAAAAAYLMLWTEFFEVAFSRWIAATAIDLGAWEVRSQALGDVVAALAGASGGRAWNAAAGAILAASLATFALASADFRRNRDNVLGGAVVGACVAAGWLITAGPLAAAWKEAAEMATTPPSRVAAQSFTFVSPMGDAIRWLSSPTDLSLVNFSMMGLLGVIAGSAIYTVSTRRFRIEWFASAGDLARHLAGGLLMGVGGVLAMGCTIGQGVTGLSVLAAGSILAFGAIVAGAATANKYLEWHASAEADGGRVGA